MLAIAVISVSAGAVLGLGFEFPAIVSLIFLGALAAIAIGAASGEGPWPIAKLTFAIATALQVGYLAGCSTKFALLSNSYARFGQRLRALIIPDSSL